MENYRKQIEVKFKSRGHVFEKIDKQLEEKISQCDENTGLLLKYLYSSMPLSDIANFPFEDYVDYASHGSMLYDECIHKQQIPEDIFLNYVVSHRVNDEAHVPCRRHFYDRLCHEIEGLSCEEIIKKVNYWCAGEVIYQSTDERTLDALSVYRSAFGRCGEESLFLVNVLRSVGIPARQIYANRWSHCDDNHAWVEAWCDGRWQFMGACEPEQILNRGWFTRAASRAMNVHAKCFSWLTPDEEVIPTGGEVIYINRTAYYAPVTTIYIEVTDSQGSPVENAEIIFSVVNYSELASVMTAVTDENGLCSLQTGIGSLHLTIRSRGQWAEQVINTQVTGRVQIKMPNIPFIGRWQEMMMEAPADSDMNDSSLTALQKKIGDLSLKDAARHLAAKKQSFGTWKRQVPNDASRICALIEKSCGNFYEIQDLLANCCEDTAKQQDLYDMLTVLPEKDLRDLSAKVIDDYLNCAARYREDWEREIFRLYILNPRVELEKLTACRGEISVYFTQEQQEEWRQAPEKIWQYIEQHTEISSQLFKGLIFFPESCLKTGLGDFRSCKILFVTICRALGIPARLDPYNGLPQYYQQGKFVFVQETLLSQLIIQGAGGARKWKYMKDWTIARKIKDEYRTLQLTDELWHKDYLSIELPTGIYRIVTSLRMPNGNVAAKVYYLNLEDSPEKLVLEKSDINLKEMLSCTPLPLMAFSDRQGRKKTADTLTNNKRTLFMWVEEGNEPTEHVLNELIEEKEQLKKTNVKINFIMSQKQNGQINRLDEVASLFDQAEIFYEMEPDVTALLARRMYVEPEKMPLVILTDEHLNGLYAVSGYNVGLVDFLIKILS